MSQKKKNADPPLAPLTDIEWATLWMAMRYAMGRETIAAGSLPGEIAQAYYHRLSDSQRRQLVLEISQHEVEYLPSVAARAFDDPTMNSLNAPHWRRLRAALDADNHQVLSVPGIEGSITAFECDGEFYPLRQYLENPFVATRLSKEFMDAAQQTT